MSDITIGDSPNMRKNVRFYLHVFKPVKFSYPFATASFSFFFANALADSVKYFFLKRIFLGVISTNSSAPI